ncbi:MAG: hypothetical protein ABJI14_15875, partial [Marinomonas sp.]
PHPMPDSKLPAYAVTVGYSSSEKLGMGDARYFRQGALEITLRTSSPIDSFTGEAGGHGGAQQFEAAILAAPRYLAGLAWDIAPEGFEVDHESGAERISEGNLTFSIEVIE